MDTVEFGRDHAGARPWVRVLACGALGLGMSALPVLALAQAGDTDGGAQRTESLGEIGSGGSGAATNDRLGSQSLDPLMVQGEAINSADAPTTGYSADATRAATKTIPPAPGQVHDPVEARRLRRAEARRRRNARAAAETSSRLGM